MVLEKKKRNSVKLIINTTETEKSRKEFLLGITNDNLLIFNEHIDNYVVRQTINHMHYEV